MALLLIFYNYLPAENTCHFIMLIFQLYILLFIRQPKGKSFLLLLLFVQNISGDNGIRDIYAYLPKLIDWSMDYVGG